MNSPRNKWIGAGELMEEEDDEFAFNILSASYIQKL
jgi:hypothetical protein